MSKYISPIIMMGVTGSGKTAVGALLASVTGGVYIDGDDLHPHENIEKMAAGIPLTDDDRWGWLDRVAEAARDNAQVVISCSALKHSYRQRLRDRIAHPLQFVFLDISLEMSLARVSQRQQHFMPASLVESQFAILERPDAEDDVLILRPLDGVNGIADTVEAIRCCLPQLI